MARETIEGLKAQLATVTGERDGHRARITELEADLSAEQGRGQAAAARVRELGGQVEALTAERDALAKSLRGYKAAGTKARNQIEVLKAEKSPVGRPIGPLRHEATAAGMRQLLASAVAAGPVTLVFSDGKRELRELNPLIVTGDAWREDPRGMVLKPEAHPLLEPGAMTRPQVSIAGVGLLDEAGDQIAWQQLVEPIVVASNGRVKVPAGTIRFNF